MACLVTIGGFSGIEVDARMPMSSSNLFRIVSSLRTSSLASRRNRRMRRESEAIERFKSFTTQRGVAADLFAASRRCHRICRCGNGWRIVA